MKILITGNMGYVGPMVVRHLRSRWPQAELIGFDAGFFADCLSSAEQFPETLLDQQHYGDVREFPPALLAGVDAVVHLAAVSNDPIGNAYEAQTNDINYLASARLAGLAEEAGVKNFVFASSCSIYGFAEGGPRTESDALNPLTAYARSKIATERALAEKNSWDMTVTCLRFATACGMSDRLRLDLVLNDFVATALATGEINVLSDGTPWRPMIDVKDMARAIEWAITRPKETGGRHLAINVGSNHWNLQVSELSKAVAEAVPGTRVNTNPNAPPDKRSYRVNFSLFERLAPDHQPQVMLSDSIRALREGLQQINVKAEDLRSARLVRLRTLERLMDKGLLSKDLRWQRGAAAKPAPQAELALKAG